MSTVAVKARSDAEQPPSAAARVFWKFAQQFASAAERVARAPRAALVEGGIKSRTRETSPSELAAELGQLSERIEGIRERLAKSSGSLVSQAEREKAQSVMAKMVNEGALVDSATFVERLKVSRQALSKALKAHRVFFVEVAGQRFYPDFYLDTRLERRQVDLVSKALGELPGASKLQFFSWTTTRSPRAWTPGARWSASGASASSRSDWRASKREPARVALGSFPPRAHG